MSRKKEATKKKTKAQKSLEISQEHGAALRSLFSQINSAKVESFNRRARYLDDEQALKEKVTVASREFEGARVEAATKMGLDPEKFRVNLETLTFEKR